MNLKKIRCKMVGHKWRYNFKSMPSKAICSECYIKARFDVFTLEWNTVKEFKGDNRSDSELIKTWTK